MACGPFDIKCHAGELLGDISAGIFGELEEWITKSASVAIKIAVTGWVSVPTPQVAANNGPVAYVQAYTYPIAFVLAVISMMVVAWRVAWSNKGEELAELARSLVTFVVLTTMGVAVVGALTAAGDIYADWIINSSLGLGPDASDSQVGERAVQVIGLAKLNPATSGLSGLILVLALGWLTISSIIQIFLSFFRGVILLALAGLLPVAAAAGMNPGGRPMLQKYMAWLLAWIGFKPAVATVYATGFWMIGTGGALDVLSGIALVSMAIFMLPALLRLLVPATAAFGGGGGMAGVMAGGAAMGAVSLAGAAMTSSGSGGGGGGGSGGGGMSVRDATHGSPSGSFPVPSAGGPAGGGGGRPGGEAPQPRTGGGAGSEAAAAGSGAGSRAGAGAGAGAATGAGAGGGAAAGAGAGAAAGAGAGGGAAAAGAAGGPVGMAAAVGVQAASQLAQTGAQAAKGAANAATGEESK